MALFNRRERDLERHEEAIEACQDREKTLNDKIKNLQARVSLLEQQRKKLQVELLEVRDFLARFELAENPLPAARGDEPAESAAASARYRLPMTNGAFRG